MTFAAIYETSSVFLAMNYREPPREEMRARCPICSELFYAPVVKSKLQASMKAGRKREVHMTEVHGIDASDPSWLSLPFDRWKNDL